MPMPVIDIPDPLPPAITLPREVIEYGIEKDLEHFGADSLVARTWRWALHGPGQAPISHTDWSPFDGDGPPSAATLAAESTASEPPLHRPTPWPELNQARFICWWCTADPEDQVPLRFRPWDTASTPVTAEGGSATVTMRKIQNDQLAT
jgi:hypothetical protein